MLFCEDHRERGERVPAEHASVVGNRLYCEECWAGAPHHVKLKGSVRIGDRAAASAPSQQEKREGSMGRKAGIDEGKVRELHGQGMNDQQISDELGCHFSSVWKVRKNLGLAAHGRGRKGQGKPARAVVASHGGEFRKERKANGHAPRAESNGPGTLVQVREELLDAIWMELEGHDKARLLNHLIEARG